MQGFGPEADGDTRGFAPGAARALGRGGAADAQGGQAGEAGGDVEFRARGGIRHR